jgi:hypothetical protein
MSDFVQTMKDWRRMCMAMEKLRPDDSCCGCPLEGYGCPAIYEEDSGHVDYADVERNVTAWAAEHPEPVYPTWYAWLANMGVVPAELPPDQAVMVTDIGLLKKIPADIAEKLGIEPKEG